MVGIYTPIAMICASNQNRSVEAHAYFLSKGFKHVRSYGTSSTCKLPGPSIDRPNIYPFGTPYRRIHDELKAKDADLYRANGLLPMLERNAKVKEFPERWQEVKEKFDFVVTFEERVFDIVVEDLYNRVPTTFEPVFVFNINTKDSHEEANVGATQAFALLQMIDNDNPHWLDSLDSILEQFSNSYSKQVLYSVLFY